jgi:hypothetical protein
MNAGARSDILGRVIGMLVFLSGVGLLFGVFYIAYRLFNMPAAEALGLKITGDPKRDPAAMTIGAQFAVLLFRIGYLLIMSAAGSLIANKGINLYFSALQGAPVNVTAKTVLEPPA